MDVVFLFSLVCYALRWQSTKAWFNHITEYSIAYHLISYCCRHYSTSVSFLENQANLMFSRHNNENNQIIILRESEWASNPYDSWFNLISQAVRFNDIAIAFKATSLHKMHFVRLNQLICTTKQVDLTYIFWSHCSNIFDLWIQQRNKSFSYQDTPLLRSILVCILNFDKTSKIFSKCNHLFGRYLGETYFVHKSRAITLLKNKEKKNVIG